MRAVLNVPGPVVVGANWYRFRSGERIHHAHVASTSFIWVVRGSGTITSGGHEFTMTSQSVLALPWMHDVDYRPDARSPFQVGTIHIVPRHDAGVPVEAHVPFLGSDPLLVSPHRGGDGRPPMPLLSSPRSISGRRVITLASYCVERFTDAYDVHVFSALGDLILRESNGWCATTEPGAGVPMTLELMTDYVSRRLDQPLTADEIAAAGSCSSATAARLFARYTGLSVLSWVRDRRMRAAAELLRTTGLRVNEVAREVGYPDPLYFSRVFRTTFGVAPSRYARDVIRP